MVAGVTALVLAATLAGCAAVGTGPATTPAISGVPLVPLVPIGWNSWNAFGCDVDQQRIEAVADAMVASGMRDAGYRYVTLDDCWVAPARDASGRLTADRTRFPDGIAALAAYVHARGLGFGLYTSSTSKTCAQRGGIWPGATGSENHERIDAATFASWGVDLVKDDWCAGEMAAGRQRAFFTAFRDGIRSAGRPMVFMINPNSGITSGVPGIDENWAGVATTVRVTHDVIPAWLTPSGTASLGVRAALEADQDAAGRDGSDLVRQDGDMLLVGQPELTEAEQRSQFAMLAILGSPLIAGNDLTAMSASTRSLLTTRAAVALATDPTSRPIRLGDQGGVRVWMRATRSGTVVAAYNPTDSAGTVSLSGALGERARSLLDGRTLSTASLDVPAHDTLLLAAG